MPLGVPEAHVRGAEPAVVSEDVLLLAVHRVPRPPRLCPPPSPPAGRRPRSSAAVIKHIRHCKSITPPPHTHLLKVFVFILQLLSPNKLLAVNLTILTHPSPRPRPLVHLLKVLLYFHNFHLQSTNYLRSSFSTLNVNPPSSQPPPSFRPLLKTFAMPVVTLDDVLYI